MMDTPALVAQQYAPAPQPYAQVAYGGFWIRVVAYVIDSFILSLISGALGLVLGIAAAAANPNALADSQGASANQAWYLVGLLIGFAYFAGFWTMNGATFAQRWLGLRVVDAATLGPIGPTKAVVRFIGLWLSFLLCFVGVVWVAFDGRKQGLMDKLAGTVVVRG